MLFEIYRFQIRYLKVACKKCVGQFCIWRAWRRNVECHFVRNNLYTTFKHDLKHFFGGFKDLKLLWMIAFTAMCSNAKPIVQVVCKIWEKKNITKNRIQYFSLPQIKTWSFVCFFFLEFFFLDFGLKEMCYQNRCTPFGDYSDFLNFMGQIKHSEINLYFWWWFLLTSDRSVD